MTKKPSTRARIDWAAARAFYVALDHPRTFVAVARRFGVSDTAVRQHATAEGWAELAAGIDRQAGERALARAVKTREQRAEAILRLTDRLVDHFADDEQFVAKAAEASFLDVERMVKLTELLLGEATDRVATSEVQQAFVLIMSAGPELAAELVTAGLKGDQFVAEFRRRYPVMVQERIALAAGGVDEQT